MASAFRVALVLMVFGLVAAAPAQAAPSRRTAKIDPRKLTIVLADEWELPKLLHTLPQHLEVIDADGPRVRIQSENPIGPEDLERVRKLPFVKSVDLGDR